MEKDNTNELETLKPESRWGGTRPNSGRPAGSKNPETILKEKALAVVRERVARSAEKLLNSQMNLAQGVQMLYKIHTDSKGMKSKPELVTSQKEIEDYLAGETDANSDYYFITTERPDNRALDSLFDRTFGKAQQYVDHTSGGEKLPTPIYGGQSSTIQLSGHDSDEENISTTQEN